MNDGAKRELQAGTWPSDTRHGHAADLHTASSILLHLFAAPVENCFEKREIKQTHLEFVILKARQKSKKRKANKES